MHDSDQNLRTIFERTRVIACVGASDKPARPSFYVSQFLMSKGYRVIPVSPRLAGGRLWGELVYPGLGDIPKQEAVDFIDLFLRSDAVLPVVETALESLPNLKTVWMQLGIQNEQAAKMAEAAGVTVIQNRCPKIEYPRLFGAGTHAG